MTDLPDKTIYRPINIDGMRPVNPEEAVGTILQMKWLDISKLYVDTRYQRDIARGDKSNTRQIAMRFKWRRFAPVIVTPILGTDCYSVIDGQHKATGALLRGLKMVPCGIISAASLQDQADSFTFLNANTTKIMFYDIFKADLAAKNADAVAINKLATECGVRFVSPKTRDGELKVGDCKTYKTFVSLEKQFKPLVFRRAVKGLAANSTSRGILNSTLIGSLCQVYKSNPQWLDNTNLDELIAQLNLRLTYKESLAKFRLEGGTQKSVLTAAFYKYLARNIK